MTCRCSRNAFDMTGLKQTSSALSGVVELRLRCSPLSARWCHRHSSVSLQSRVARRYNSTTPEPLTQAPKKAGRGLRRTVLGASFAFALFAGYVYATDTRASVHRYVAVPLIRWMYPDAEEAHHVGVGTLKWLYRYGLNPRERGNPDGDGALQTEVFHLCVFCLEVRMDDSC